MIEAIGIKKSFGTLEVLKRIDFLIKKAEIVSIVGKSGAGKTTLLQIIGTLNQANSGEILINNINIKALKDKQLSVFRNKEIGFVFQFHHLLPEFTALENVGMPAFIAKTNKKDAMKKAEELLGEKAIDAKEKIERLSDPLAPVAHLEMKAIWIEGRVVKDDVRDEIHINVDRFGYPDIDQETDSILSRYEDY